MKINLTPQRLDLTVAYRAIGETLEVTVDGRSDSFDFSGAPDGNLHNFESDTLPLCPILRAEKSGDDIMVWALGWYGPRPERDMQYTPVTDDAGEIIDYHPEPDTDYEARLAEWEAQTVEREIHL